MLPWYTIWLYSYTISTLYNISIQTVMSSPVSPNR